MAIHEINKPEGHYLKGDILQVDDEIRFKETANPEIDSSNGPFIWVTKDENLRSWVLRNPVTGEDILIVDTTAANKTVSVIAPYTLLGATAVTPNVINKAVGDSPYTASSYDVILADATGGVVTIELPVASANALIRIKKTDAVNNVSIDANGAETIDGSGTYTLTTINQTISLFSDGSNWFIF